MLAGAAGSSGRTEPEMWQILAFGEVAKRDLPSDTPAVSKQHFEPAHSKLTFKTAVRCLTSFDFSTKIDRMTELETLEQKLTQLIDLYQQARGDNRDLRQRVAQLEIANSALTDKVAAARAQLEALIERIPAGEEA